jgi:serine/threonine protein kinase
MGFVHRDLKDEVSKLQTSLSLLVLRRFGLQNVVVDADYNIKLVDFGSAARIPTRVDEYFTYSKFNGTMHFASPEICKRMAYRGPEAEIW